MLMRAVDDGWSAEITISPIPDDWFSVAAHIRGDSKHLALAGAERVLKLLASGREAFIRIEPEADSQSNFISKTTLHRGIVRFSYREKAGKWYYPQEAINPLSLNSLHDAATSSPHG